MNETIHWPDNCDLGRWPRGGNDWYIQDGVLQCKQATQSQNLIEMMHWKEAVFRATYSKVWAAWMRQRAQELGFMQPPRPTSELLAELKTQIERVASAGSIQEVQEALK